MYIHNYIYTFSNGFCNSYTWHAGPHLWAVSVPNGSEKLIEESIAVAHRVGVWGLEEMLHSRRKGKPPLYNFLEDKLKSINDNYLQKEFVARTTYTSMNVLKYYFN